MRNQRRFAKVMTGNIEYTFILIIKLKLELNRSNLNGVEYLNENKVENSHQKNEN